MTRISTLLKATEPFEVDPTKWIEPLKDVKVPNPQEQKQVAECAVARGEELTRPCCDCGCQLSDRFGAIAELMPVPAIVCRAANREIVYANKLFSHILGIFPPDATYRREEDLYYDPAAGQSMLEVLNRDGSVRDREIRLKKADATPLWVAVSLQIVTVENEEAILCTFSDISERKRVEELLRESEERYQKLAELSADAIAICAENKLVYINLPGVQLVGDRHPEALIGKSLIDFIHPDYREELTSQVFDFTDRSPSQISKFHSKIVKLDEQIIDVEISAVAVPYQGQPATQILIRDIGDRSQHQKALLQAKSQLQTMLEAVPGIVSWISSDLRYLGVNQHLAKLYGLHPDAFVGQHVGFLGASPEFSEFACQFFAKNATESVQELTARVNDEERSYLIVAQKLDLGQSAFIVGIDITERKRTAQALQKSEAKLRALLNSSQQSILLIDRNYKIQAFNKTAKDIAKIFLGKLLQEGDLIYEYVCESNLEEFERDFGDALQGKVVRKERNFKSISTKDRWFEINYNPVLNESCEVSAVYFSALNIDKRQKAIQALAKSEERFRSLVQNSSDLIAILEADGTMRYESPSVERILGYVPQELISKNAFDYVHPEDVQTVREAFFNAIQKPGSAVKVEFRFRHAGGFWVCLEAIGSNRLNDCAIAGFVVNCRDITTRKQQEERLRLLERAIAASSNGIVITDAQQPDNPAVYVNPSFEVMTGYSTAEVLGRNCRYLQGKENNQLGLDELRAAIRDGKDCKVILRNYHKNGSLFWNELRISPVYNEQAQLTHFIGVQTDITDRKVAEEELIYNAFHDPLTGLPNRALLMDRLGCAIARTKRHPDYLCALLFLDLDRFKVVNDSLGHTVGDRLLGAIARRLEACLQELEWPIESFPGSIWELEAGCSLSPMPVNSLVACLGGDRFVILLEGIREVGDATTIAEQIHKKLLAPFSLDGHEVFITTSIGIAFSSLGYYWQGDLLRDADIAMHHAKGRGKARYAVFNKAMHNRAVALLQLENDLHRALDRQEFQLYYQPIVSLSTGKIVGFEALVRWQHRDRGMVSPSEFIPVAEETGIIFPLGIWVLREACRQMRQWQQGGMGEEGRNSYLNSNFSLLTSPFSLSHPQLTISVNLSGKQFLQLDLVEQIDQILQETGLDARCLKLEITESAIVDNIESATKTLLQLRARNIQLCLDDFGTGYSSLSYLHQFPINTLKIDRSFVNRLGAEGENAEIVRAIVMLAHSLRMDVTAEGAETKEQLAQLRALGCEYGQGYFFSKPLPSQAASSLLARSPQW